MISSPIQSVASLTTTLAAVPAADVTAVRLFIQQIDSEDELAEMLTKVAEIEKALVQLDQHLGHMQRLVAACRALPAKPASELVLGI